MNKLAKRGIFLGLLLLSISLITIYVTIDVEAFLLLKNINISAVLLALFCLIIGLYFDGLRLQRLVRIAGINLPVRATLQVIAGNYFMAMLTPGATGGAVAQVLLLKSLGVPVSLGMPIVLVRTIFSIVFLIVALPFIFLVDDFSIPYISQDFLLWTSFGGLLILILGLALFQRRIAKEFIFRIFRYGNVKRCKRVLTTINNLNKGFAILYQKPWQSVLVFWESALSLLFLYGIAPALMWAFVENLDIVEILCRMIVLNLILYFAPTPGGAGVAEGLFVFFFTPYVPLGLVGVVAVAWRVIAEYIPFFLGMYGMFTVYGKHYIFSKKEDV